MKIIYAFLLTIVVSVSVSASLPIYSLLERASFDFDCPTHELTLVEIDDLTRGVKGCGKKAVYIANCVGFNCTWILNTNRSELK